MSRKKLLKLENLNDFIPKTIGDRINFIVGHSGMNGSNFCKLIEISTGNLNGLINDDVKPSAGFMSRILENFNVNINWLLTGKGEMILKPEKPETDYTEKKGDELRAVDIFKEHQKVLIELGELKNENENLKAQLKELMDPQGENNEFPSKTG